MNAVTYTFCCANCGRCFNAPEASEFSYGQFVLRSKESDYEAFLDATNDSAFLESYELVKAHCRAATMNDEQKGELQQQIFGVACDPAPEGQQLMIGLTPKCNACGSRRMASWEQITPVQPWPLPSVTHEKWNALAKHEKVVLIDQAVRKQLDGK